MSGHFGTGDHFGLELAYTSGGWDGASYYNGNVARMVEAYSEESGSSDRTLGYGYDGINRLRQAAPEINGDPICCLDLCAYDRNSNLAYYSHRDNPDNEYIYYSGTNRLEKVDGMPGHGDDNYLYDGNGNMTSDDSKSITLQYDYRNMLTQVSKEKVLLGRTVYDNLYFAYDAGGRRVRKLHVGKYVCECGGGGSMGPGPGGRLCICTGTDETYYIYSGNVVIAEYDEEGAGTNKYIYAGNDRIAIIRNTEQDTLLMFLLKDHLGTTRAVVKDDGEVAAKYQYYSFGDEYSSWINQGTDYKFSGKELDEESGFNFYYFGARYYEPRIGRWFSVDPAGQGFSPYVYCGNNPLIMVDEQGEFWFLAPVVMSLAFTTYAWTQDVPGGDVWKFALGGAFTGFGLGLSASMLSSAFASETVVGGLIKFNAAWALAAGGVTGGAGIASGEPILYNLTYGYGLEFGANFLGITNTEIGFITSSLGGQDVGIQYRDGHFAYFGGPLGTFNPHTMITVGHAIFVNTSEYNLLSAEERDEMWNEEFYHTRQYTRGWGWGFLGSYLYYHWKRGYDNNPYEIQAKRYAARGADSPYYSDQTRRTAFWGFWWPIW